MSPATAARIRWRVAASQRSASALTLIELMVVMAVIAILCAILLPTITSARTSAQSAACKANLRQLGVALNMYVTDHGIYPSLARAAIRDGRLEVAGGGYLVGDPDYYPTWGAFLDYIPPGSGKVLLCPARRPSTNSFLYSVDYGFNAIGAAWDGNKRLALGLTPTQIRTNASSSSISSVLGSIQVTYETMVVDPSDMIALGDCLSTPGFLEPSRVDPVHNAGANVAFCDGHVEYGKQRSWVEPTAKVMLRWNRDHQPHLKE